MGTIAIMLVDNNTLFRKVLRQVFEGQDGLTVIGEADDGWTAQSLAEQLRPDVVLIDLSVPLSDGICTSEAITRTCPGTRVIILTMYDEEVWTIPAIEAGAVGCLAKTLSPAKLIAAVRDAADACC